MPLSIGGSSPSAIRWLGFRCKSLTTVAISAVDRRPIRAVQSLVIRDDQDGDGSRLHWTSRKQFIESTNPTDSKASEASTSLSINNLGGVDSASLPSTSKAADVVEYPRNPSATTSTLVELTTRLDFFKEMRSQLMEQLQNLDLNSGPTPPDFVVCPDYRVYTHSSEKVCLMLLTEFSKAVEQKQVAQQEAKRSKFVVMKAEQERRATIIRAEGESESAKLISDATAAAGMGLIELRKIEAAKENATSMSKNGNVVYLPNNNMFLGLNTGL